MQTISVQVIENGRELGTVTAMGPRTGTYDRDHWQCVFDPAPRSDERYNFYDIVDSTSLDTVRETAATWFRWTREGLAGVDDG